MNRGVTITTALLLLSSIASAREDPTDLEVRVVSPEFTAIAGIPVYLCPQSEPHESGPPTEDCRLVATDATGTARFEELEPAAYRVGVSITGFLQTEIRGLPLTAEDRRSWDVHDLVLVLNPVTVY